MIEKWELAHFPFEKDQRRYKARVQGTEDDLKELISKLPVESGRPFVTLSQDFDWAFYLYKLEESAKIKAVEVFKGFSQNGTVIDSAVLHVEKELPPMLEDILEVTAKALAKTHGTESVKPPETVEEKATPVAEEPKKEPAPEKVPEINSTAARIEEALNTPLNPNYVFTSFIVGPNNRFTHAAAQAVADNPGKIYNPFFIHGGVGLGKTHLMQAVGHFVLSKTPGKKIVFISTEKFTSQVIEAIRKGQISQLREHFRTVDVILIDDIQFLAGSESTQEEFFHVFNNLHQLNKQIVITSDRPPKQLSTLEDRLRSRFEWGLITDLKAPNFETRVAILKSKSDQIGLTLTNEQLKYVAEHSKSNIRELEGIVKKIYATTSLMKTKVDMELLKGLMEDVEASVPLQEPRIESPPPEKMEPKKEPKKEKKDDPELTGIMNRLNEAIHAPAPPTPPTPPPPAPEPPPKVTPAPQPVVTPPQPVSPSVITAEPVPKPSTPPLVLKAEPVPPTSPVPEPVAEIKLEVKSKPEPAVSESEDETPDPEDPDTDMKLRAVEVICFYPTGKKDDFRALRSKFYSILKKHKLKFRLSRLSEKPFKYEGKLDYNSFAEACRKAKCSIAIVLGPPPTPILSEDDFAGMLSSILDEERVSLQFIPWSEMSKDYRYLNCALDLSLLIPVGDPGKGGPKA